jgi:hypothetical protein
VAESCARWKATQLCQWRGGDANGRRGIRFGDDTLKVDLESGRELRTLEGTQVLSRVAVTPTAARGVRRGRHAEGVGPGKCRELRTLEGHSASVYGMAVTPWARGVRVKTKR